VVNYQYNNYLKEFNKRNLITGVIIYYLYIYIYMRIIHVILPLLLQFLDKKIKM